MGGIDRIAKERKRQVRLEWWPAQHDDEHRGGELAQAAACYATGENTFRFNGEDYEELLEIGLDRMYTNVDTMGDGYERIYEAV